MYKTNSKSDLSKADSPGLMARMSEMASFWGVILLSAAALAAIAFVTPVVLAVAAVVGLTARNKPHSSWRSSRA